MLRSALLWASTNPFMAERLPRYRFVRRAVRRFMPGEAADDALAEAERLAGRGVPALVTQLGENVGSDAEAQAVADHYQGLLGTIQARGLDIELSVKPTQLGLDQSVDRTRERIVALARAAGEGIVWIDMEGSSYVEPTLEVYRGAASECPNVGICLQAYLHRTEADFEALLDLRPHVRLVKGAYREPPEVAHPRKASVDEAFRRLASRMLRERHAGRMGRPGVATHDARLVADARRVAHELGLGADRWEVEMLYGIGSDEQARLVQQGVPLRVLISYGSHWFPWYMRRLAERPANVAFVLRQLVAR